MCIVAPLTALQLDFASVDRGPDLEADAGCRPTDLLSGMDGSLGAVEHGHKPVAGRRDLASPKSVEHGPHRMVVPASVWLGSVADPKVVQRILGHANGGDHNGPVPAHLWDAAQRLGGMTAARSNEGLDDAESATVARRP
jgi:hypothetical protein